MYYLCMVDHARTEQQCPLHRFAAGNLDKIILQQLALLVWGRDPRAFPQIMENASFSIGGAAISYAAVSTVPTTPVGIKFARK